MNQIIRDFLLYTFGKNNYEKYRYVKNRILYSSRKKINFCPCCNNCIKKWQSFKKYNWVEDYNVSLFNPLLDKCNCPICDSAPRHRIEADFLEHLDLTEKKILLWAPENGLIQYFVRKNVQIITADMHKKNVMQKENIEATTFNDNQFDIIICNHVLEHVTNVTSALKDTLRILKEDGIALIMVPQDLTLEKTIEDEMIKTEIDRKMIYGQSDHLRLFGNDFYDILASAGFVVTKYIGIQECAEEILPVIAPSNLDSNILYVCRKQKENKDICES